jgi:hypothetical protein
MISFFSLLFQLTSYRPIFYTNKKGERGSLQFFFSIHILGCYKLTKIWGVTRVPLLILDWTFVTAYFFTALVIWKVVFLIQSSWAAMGNKRTNKNAQASSILTGPC